MVRSEIRVGEEYVLREGKAPDAPLQRVKIIQHVRGKKWKAEWIDPNPGLIEYVESQKLVVRWKDRKVFFQEEEKARQLRADDERHGFDDDSPVDNAVTQVFESIGEKDLQYYRGILSGSLEALHRVRGRANFDRKKSSAFAYTDRFGTVNVPYAEALELAKAFCAAEPNTVLLNTEGTEREWVQEASHPGNEYMRSLLGHHPAMDRLRCRHRPKGSPDSTARTARL